MLDDQKGVEKMSDNMMPRSLEASLMSYKQVGTFEVYKATGKARDGHCYAAECAGWRLEGRVRWAFRKKQLNSQEDID